MRLIWESLGNTIGIIGSLFFLFVIYKIDTVGFIKMVEPNFAIMLGEYLAVLSFLGFLVWRQYDDVVQDNKRRRKK